MKLEFYKRGQGYYTRMGTAIGAGLIVVLGCLALYNKLEGITTVDELKKVLTGCIVVVLMVIANVIFFKQVPAKGTRAAFFFISAAVLITLACVGFGQIKPLFRGITELEPMKTWVRAAVPTVVFASLAWVIFRVLNTPQYADFMIDTEGEMKKVSWSTKKEIVTSTKVVIVTVVLMAAMLAVVDLCFAKLLNVIGVLQVVN